MAPKLFCDTPSQTGVSSWFSSSEALHRNELRSDMHINGVPQGRMHHTVELPGHKGSIWCPSLVLSTLLTRSEHVVARGRS